MKSDPSSPSPQAATIPTLDAAEALTAAATLGPAGRGRARLQKTFRRLVLASSWSDMPKVLERSGLSPRHLRAPLRELLEVPGDLVLLRMEGSRFALLRHQENRWHVLSPQGDLLQHQVPTDDTSPLEAMILTLPQAEDPSRGFLSLAALWPELRAAWAEVGVASLFINAGQLLLPIFALLIYDKIALNGLFETLWALVFGMGLYLLTDAGMRLVRSWTTERISTDLAHRSDETLWARLVAQVELPAGGFPRFLSNYRDLTLARDFVSSTYLLSIADLPFLLLYLGVIGFIAWPLMVACLVLVLLYAGAGLLLQRRQTRLSKEAEQQNTLKLAFMGETLGCLDVVRTSPGAGMFVRSWRKLTDQTTSFDTRRRLAAHQTAMFSTAMQTVTTVVILTAGVHLIYAQHMTIGKLIACNLLAGRAMALVASFFTVIGKWEDFKRSAERMGKSLEDVEEHACPPRPEISGNIAVIGVGKHYEGRPAALEAVSFDIRPGETVALLGRPGAGKSTLLRCLAGLCRPDAGQVLIDGLALEDIARFDRVRWLAYKAQDPAIFAGTLEDNLRISGCQDAERFSQALWACGMENEFKSGRMSLGMSLEERGSNLSGGQRQKVALARAFAQSSRILLLDEPTLGLDPESERLLAERLPKLLGDSTTLIMTTHSPIMLKSVQRVIVLDGGKVVADGPREKLVTIS